MSAREIWLNLTDTIVEPTTAFRRLRERPMAWIALAISAATISLSIISDPSFQIMLDEFATGFDVTVDPVVFVWFMLGFSLSFYLFVTWLLLLVGRAFGGSCTYAGLFSAVGFAQLPSIFRVPMIAFASAVWPPLAIWGGFALAIWGIVLFVLGVRESMQLSTFQSIMALILTMFLFVISLFVVGLIVALIGFAMAALVLP